MDFDLELAHGGTARIPSVHPIDACVSGLNFCDGEAVVRVDSDHVLWRDLAAIVVPGDAGVRIPTYDH